jgi:hypothetical protein
MNILDPRLIPQSLMPLIWFWNQPGNIISNGIDWRTGIKGIAPQSHAMLSINQGKFVTQNMSIFNGYTEVPMEKYMVKGGVLTCVSLVNNSPAFASAFSKSVQKRLTAPWYVTQYDFIGVFFGQLWGVPELIHTPGLRYCSVDVLRHLTNASPYLPKQDQLVINSMPAEISPELFYDDTLKYNPPFNQYGQWNSTTGVVIGG